MFCSLLLTFNATTADIVYLSDKNWVPKKIHYLSNAFERFWEKNYQNYITILCFQYNMPYSIISPQYLKFPGFWLIQFKRLCKIPNQSSHLKDMEQPSLLMGKKYFNSFSFYFFPTNMQTLCPFSCHVAPMNKSNCCISNSPDQKMTRSKDGILISKLSLRISMGSYCCAPFRNFESSAGWIQLVRVGVFLKYVVVLGYTNQDVSIS